MKWISMIFFCLNFFISFNTFAYKFTSDVNGGSFWQKFPIPVAIILGSESERESLERIIKESEKEWESASSVDIWDIASGIVTTTFQNNYIRWSDHFEEETGFDGEYTLAVTIRYQRSPYITKSEIILNGNLDYLRANEGGALKKTILHEMGHSIGLDHSENSSSIMNAYISGISSLQPDDKAGVIAVTSKIMEQQKTNQVAGLNLNGVNENSIVDMKKMVSACGSVDLKSSDSSNPGGGVRGFLGSLLVGIILTGLMKIRLDRKNLPAIIRSFN